MNICGLDLYLNRGYPNDPKFAIIREPGSVEVNLLGWTVIASWAPVQSDCTCGAEVIDLIGAGLLRNPRGTNADHPKPSDEGVPVRRGAA